MSRSRPEKQPLTRSRRLGVAMSNLDAPLPPDDSVQPPPAGFPPGPPEGITPAPPPQPVATAPAWPLHPNFWFGLLWCFVVVSVTQIIGGVLAVAILLVAFWGRLDQLTPQAMMKGEEAQLALGAAFFVS